MNLPLTKNRLPLRLVTKYCEYQDCNKEFQGRTNQKFCNFHKDVHNRIRPKRIIKEINHNNIIPHNLTDVTSVEFMCALKGCKNKFTTKLFPKQNIYPKYCEEHRNQFKREQFIKENS